MIFLSNSQGTITAVVPEPINQGSNNVNRVILIAPFPSSNVVSVAFTLPNGHYIPPKISERDPGYNMTIIDGFSARLFDQDGAEYNAWQMSIEHPLTAVSGTLRVQFFISSPHGTLATSESTLPINQGTPVLLTSPPSPQQWQLILQAVSAAAQEAAQSHEHATASQRYALHSEKMSCAASKSMESAKEYATMAEEAASRSLPRIMLESDGSGADPEWGSEAYDRINTGEGVYAEHYGSDGTWRPILHPAGGASIPGDADVASRDRYLENLKSKRVVMAGTDGRILGAAPDGSIYRGSDSTTNATINKANTLIPEHYADGKYAPKLPKSTTDDVVYTVKKNDTVPIARPVSTLLTPGKSSVPVRNSAGRFEVGDVGGASKGTTNYQALNARSIIKNLDLVVDEDYKLSLIYRQLEKTGMPEGTTYVNGGALIGQIDLPLESVVIDAEYFENAKILKLTLNNGKTLEIPASDITYDVVIPLVYKGDALKGLPFDSVIGYTFVAPYSDFSRDPHTSETFTGMSRDEKGVPYYYIVEIEAAEWDEVPPIATCKVIHAEYYGRADVAETLSVSMRTPLVLPGSIKNYINDDHLEGDGHYIDIMPGEFDNERLTADDVGKGFSGFGYFTDDGIAFYYVATLRVVDYTTFHTIYTQYIIPFQNAAWAQSAQIANKAATDIDNNLIHETYAKIDNLTSGELKVKQSDFSEASKAITAEGWMRIGEITNAGTELESAESTMPIKVGDVLLIRTRLAMIDDADNIVTDTEGNTVLSDTSTSDIIIISDVNTKWINYSAGTNIRPVISDGSITGWRAYNKYSIYKDSSGRFMLQSRFPDIWGGDTYVKKLTEWGG